MTWLIWLVLSSVVLTDALYETLFPGYDWPVFYLRVVNLTVSPNFWNASTNATFGQRVRATGTFRLVNETGHPLIVMDLHEKYGHMHFTSGCVGRNMQFPGTLGRVNNCPDIHTGIMWVNEEGASTFQDFQIKGYDILGQTVDLQWRCSCYVNCPVIGDENQVSVWSDSLSYYVGNMPPIPPNITSVVQTLDECGHNQTEVTFTRGRNHHMWDYWSGPGVTNGWWDHNYTIYWSDNATSWHHCESQTFPALDSRQYPDAHNMTVTIHNLTGSWYWSIVATNVFNTSARSVFSSLMTYPLC